MEKVQELDNETFQKVGKAEITIKEEGVWRLFKDHAIIPGRVGSVKYVVNIGKCIVGEKLEIGYSVGKFLVGGESSKGVVTEIFVGTA